MVDLGLVWGLFRVYLGLFYVVFFQSLAVC